MNEESADIARQLVELRIEHRDLVGHQDGALVGPLRRVRAQPVVMRPPERLGLPPVVAQGRGEHRGGLPPWSAGTGWGVRRVRERHQRHVERVDDEAFVGPLVLPRRLHTVLGDGLRIEDEPSLELVAESDTEVLLFDMP